MNITNLVGYKEYIEDTYETLTLNERMYYVNLIKNADECCSDNYCWFSYDENRYFEEITTPVNVDIHQFFSDACVHIQNKIEPLIKFEIDDWYKICGDFIIDGDKSIDRIEYIKNKDILNIHISEDTCVDDIYFDYHLLDEDYLDAVIKEKLETKRDFFIRNEKSYSTQLDKINKHMSAFARQSSEN